MSNNILGNDNRFIVPDYTNSSITALLTAYKHLAFNKKITFSLNISSTAEKLWNEKKSSDVRSIVLVLADSLGSANIKETNILESYLNEGIEVDTCAPTVTATAMASLSHILTPAMHGLVGYNIYHEKIGNLFNALGLKTLDKQNNPIDINELGIVKEDIIAGLSAAEIFANHANKCNQTIHSRTFVPEALEVTGLSRYLFPVESINTYNNFDPTKMLSLVWQELLYPVADIQFFVLYFPHTDYMSHIFGAKTKKYTQALSLIAKAVEHLSLHPKIISGDAVLIITSDHGQVDLPKISSPKRVQITPKNVLEHNKQGFFIGNSGRLLHIYYNTEKGGKNAEEFINKYFAHQNNGIVIEQKEATQLLDSTPNLQPEFVSRFGKKIVLMDENFFLDYPDIVPYGDTKLLQAQHGGLTPREVKVPFIII